ncbi:hypothetical protein CEUSTIGMA_g4911.t1 [Chlamydomonas eustigma]|uniref:Uncharacterized protein n=1 Tax=Chlamydomonas eustigma TaxID=1157962 RepID=A0A250X316_9CHLO|nr:hypothetical protein CEUSTIGMA_g4911.t1 [Chlamydomonas eustigma]|eukprot:GAX77467.1 hypothetical protein CEUSTIGMA_g4911.t1 [Chlamydomonas eustigma]
MTVEKLRLLVCVSTAPPPPEGSGIEYFDPTTSASGVLSASKNSEAEVKVLSHGSYHDFKYLIEDFKPNLVYLGASATFDLDKQLGGLESFSFKDGASADSILGEFFAGKAVQTLYIDAHANYEHIEALQARGDVPNVIAWSNVPPPAVIAAQFARTFFSVLTTYKAAPNEAYAIASHVAKAHCTSLLDGSHISPALPSFLSALKAELPDNNSIPALDYPGVDPSQSLSTSIPGWSDLRLLAPRAEVRLLLCGGSSLVDSHRLSFLGEALRALLVLETRNARLVSTTPCAKVPVNLAAGCAATKCELRTASGRTTTAILGGQPEVIKEQQLVQHALRMTLVSDSQSLQFRLPPPGMPIPAPRTSVAIAGSTPVVDALVLTSVWAVQVLRGLCQDAESFGLISMGIAAVGASATAGLTAEDVQRLKMIVSGNGPSVHPAVPLPESTAMGGKGRANGSTPAPCTVTTATAAAAEGEQGEAAQAAPELEECAPHEENGEQAQSTAMDVQPSVAQEVPQAMDVEVEEPIVSHHEEAPVSTNADAVPVTAASEEVAAAAAAAPLAPKGGAVDVFAPMDTDNS